MLAHKYGYFLEALYKNIDYISGKYYFICEARRYDKLSPQIEFVMASSNSITYRVFIDEYIELTPDEFKEILKKHSAAYEMAEKLCSIINKNSLELYDAFKDE